MLSRVLYLVLLLPPVPAHPMDNRERATTERANEICLRNSVNKKLNTNDSY